MPNHDKELKKAFERIKKINISNENITHINNFLEQISAEGLGKTRQIKYLYTLGKIAKMLDKDFSKANKNDIVKLCSKLNNSELKEWTKHDYKVVIKRFYKWLREEEGQDLDKRQYPREVSWITVKMKKIRKRLPKELLTIEDVKKIANHANNLRDRCLILLLYETGARIGEILNLKIKDVEFDKYGALVNLFGKTGERKVRVIASAPSISNWLLEHPSKTDKNSFLICGLWSKKRGEKLGYQTIRLMLKEAAEKAKINKPMNPHHFRHSRATELAKSFTEAQLCEYMGWVQGSQEASTYVHLSGRDMDNAILKMHGLIEEEKPEEKFQIIKCPRCGIKNDPGARFCSGCSLGLDLKNLVNIEKDAKNVGFNLMDVLNNPDFVIRIGNLLAEEYSKYKKQK
jgi:site-specific recombinase XerD